NNPLRSTTGGVSPAIEMQMRMAGSSRTRKDAPVAVTMGDPAGIGPDVTILSWLLRDARACPPFFALGDVALYAERAASFSAKPGFKAEAIGSPDDAHAVFARALPVLPLETPLSSVQAGKPDGAHAQAIIASIERAVALTLSGHASATVTAPIAK